MNKDSKYQEVNTRKFLSDTKYYEGYSRFREMDGRYETWDESVDRVLETHKRKYSHLIDDEKFNSLIDEVEIAYKNKTVLGAQRALQFGGDQLLKHEFRIYNCASSYVDRASFFGECFYVLLAGAGAGISVQKQHVNKLPEIRPRNKRPKTHIIQDSIEGWATSLDVLLSSFFVGGGVHPEYEGKKVYFDSSEVRGKGELISGGFKAPGPEPLVKALNLIERLLNDIAEEGILRPIDAYDIVMHFADAVLAGGVRRCIGSGSKVHTSKGMVNIENVLVGDEVLTTDGYHKIKNKFYQGKQKLVKIKTQDGFFECTKNHKIAILTGPDEYKWVEAQNLKEDDRMISPSFGINGDNNVSLPEFEYIKPKHSTTCKDIIIPELDNDIAWLIGLIQGDGCVRITSKTGEVNIACANDYPDIIIKATNQLKRFGINVTYTYYDNYTVVKVKSKQLATYFHSWLKQPNTSIKIPEFIWKSSKDIKMNMISGLMDADGSVKCGRSQIATSIYPNFLREIQLLVNSCGMQTRLKLSRKEQKDKNYKALYSLSAINNSSKNILNEYGFKKGKISLREQYTNTMLDGTSWSKSDNKLIPVKVVSIDENNQELYETWDIEIEDRHEFFCDGYLVHNSATLCVFSKGDEEMMKAKTGNWFVDNPQRARSNNSVLLLRNELTFDEFKSYMLKVQQFGEPGFIFTDDLRHLYNPCITGDTLINTSKGLRRADSLINIPFEAVVNGKNYKSEGFIKTNTEFVNHIKTFSGHNISITNNHKMKILENGKEIWRRCDELKIGDKMVVSDDVKKENYTRVGEIVEIIRSKKPYKVYDCSVDEIHCFEANGLISHNCVEISMYPQIDGISGWESCNLSEINGAKCITKEKFYEACRTASIVGTLQAGYTNFKFLSEASKKIIEREALIGVSVTGWMNNPNVLFDDETLRKGARIVKETNREVAKILGINPAARTTCTKPSGNACAGFDTKIKTNKGIMSLEEIFKYCNNDIDIKNLSPDSWVEVKNKLYVFDENNDIRGISNLYNNGIKEVYEIEFEDEKTYSFTGEHKLKTITGWKKVKDINKNDEIVSF